MTDFAVRMEDCSKLYRIGGVDPIDDGRGGLRDLFFKPLANFRKYRSLYNFTPEELAGEPRDDILWALRHVSMDIRQGDAVGIVGANGAGKSTTLKLVSRITPPTMGQLQVRGRVSSLLEVGTGFHQELTGRENVYMNGTILGMRRAEVRRKFDDIADFANISKFIDTPVKRYSSGMRVRLAFSVMAHLDPDILVVDEVLAVGDAEFQRKCLNRMGDVGGEGKTVIFVSHNMAAINRLCNRAVLLRNGEVQLDATPEEVVHAHLVHGHGTVWDKEWENPDDAPGDESVRLRRVRLVNAAGDSVGRIEASEPIGIEITYDVLEGNRPLSPYCVITGDDGTELFSSGDPKAVSQDDRREPGRYRSIVQVPGSLLTEGQHYVRVVMRDLQRKKICFAERDVVAFNVTDREAEILGSSWWEGKHRGVIRPRLDWLTEYEPPQT